MSTPNENAKYTTYKDVYARLTAIIKNKIINEADVMEWCIQCEIEWLGDFPKLVPYMEYKVAVKDYMARIPPHCARLLDVFDKNENLVRYYSNGGYMIFNSDFKDKEVYINFAGIMLDERGIPLIKKGHEEACMRHCIVNMYYEDFLAGKIHGQAYGEMKEERNIQVEAAKQDMSDYDRNDLMEIAAVRLNMIPHLRYGSLYHKEIGG